MDSDIERKVDKLIQKKKPRFRKLWIVFGIALGAFLTAFILITSIVIPILDDRRLAREADEEPVEPVGADEPEAYHYWYAPENSFGISSTKTANWSYFKSLFLEHTDWILEYKRYEYSDWTDGSDYLTIERTWNDTGFWKFKLIFDVPVHIYSARFTFGIDLNCLQYVERSGYEVWINYTANATETYSVMFNWSDIASIPNLVITKGVQDGMFWFRFRRDNIPAGHYEFDPTFGTTGVSGQYKLVVLSNQLRGSHADSPASDGIADSMWAKLNDGTWAPGEEVTCALYDAADASFVASTDEVSSGGGGGDVYYEFTFAEPKPSVFAAKSYYCVAFTDDSIQLYYKREGDAANHPEDDDETYPNFPATADLVSSITNFAVYCSYTEAAEEETWQVVDDTINGEFTNTTSWQNVDDAINGAFTNTTTWQEVDTTINGAFTNITAWQDVDISINGEFTNVSTKTWQNVDTTYNGVFTNTTTWQDVDTSINGAFTNTTTWQDVDTTYNGVFTNATTWQDVDTSINGEFTNVSIRTWQNVDTTINGAFTNTTTWQDIDTSINGEFTNVSVVSNIIITSPYPANGSTDVAVNTSLHFTVNHTLGHLMNITVYTGSNMTNCSALLGNFNSVANGTYYLGYHNASNVSTEYAWRVNVTDAYGNYAQEIYNFTTASTRGEIYAMGNPTGYGIGMVMAFAMAFGMLFLVVGMMLFRRRSRRNE